jgi:hypothetical protein
MKIVKVEIHFKARKCTCTSVPMFSTTNTNPTHMVPITTTIAFMIRLAHFSEIGFLVIGRIKSSNITPVIEFRPVDIEL